VLEVERGKKADLEEVSMKRAEMFSRQQQEKGEKQKEGILRD
jgi:hypothetical protein